MSMENIAPFGTRGKRRVNRGTNIIKHGLMTLLEDLEKMLVNRL